MELKQHICFNDNSQLGVIVIMGNLTSLTEFHKCDCLKIPYLQVSVQLSNLVLGSTYRCKTQGEVTKVAFHQLYPAAQSICCIWSSTNNGTWLYIRESHKSDV